MNHHRLIFFSTVLLLAMLSCNLPNAASAPDIAATVAALNAATQAAGNSAAAPGSSESQPSIEDDPVPPPPAFSEITFPSELGTLEERDGRYFLNDQPVALTYHRTINGDLQLWLTLEEDPSWPVMIQNTDGSWRLGVEAWQANVTFVNTNETPLNVSIYTNGEEASTLELNPYEVYNLASLPSGNYQFRFLFQGSETYDLTCSTTLSQTTMLSFVVVPIGVAVTEEGVEPQSSADLDIRTSPLCGGQP